MNRHLIIAVFKDFTLLFLLGFVACSCGITGISAIDDINYPLKSCIQDFYVDNQTNEDLYMYVSISESTHDSACQNKYSDQNEKVLPPGEIGKIRAELKCRQCAVHKSYSVSSMSNTSLILYDESMGSAKAACHPSGCHPF